MIKSNKLIALLLVLFSFVFCNQAISKTKFVSTQKYWNVYVTEIKKTKTCFMTSEPTSTSGKFDKKNRGKPYVFVTNTKGGASHEVSIKAGFNFKRNFDVIFNVDGKKTNLFPVDDRAWSESSKIDRVLVQSMRKGKKLMVIGTSAPGNKITDTYNLAGFTKALNIVDKSCS